MEWYRMEIKRRKHLRVCHCRNPYLWRKDEVGKNQSARLLCSHNGRSSDQSPESMTMKRVEWQENQKYTYIGQMKSSTTSNLLSMLRDMIISPAHTRTHTNDMRAIIASVSQNWGELRWLDEKKKPSNIHTNISQPMERETRIYERKREN